MFLTCATIGTGASCGGWLGGGGMEVVDGLEFLGAPGGGICCGVLVTTFWSGSAGTPAAGVVVGGFATGKGSFGPAF